MKTIDDIIKKTRQERLKELASFLNLRSASETKIKTSILNPFTIHKILSSLTSEELAILKLIYTGHDGITFGEIQKNLAIDIEIIEKSMERLTGFLLTYVTKNRQLLNKKMDKAYCIDEIDSIFKISEISDVREYIQNAQEALIDGRSGNGKIEKLKDDKSLAVIRKITEAGCIINLDVLINSLPDPDFFKKTADLHAKGYLKLFFLISEKLNVCIALDEDVVPDAPELLQTEIFRKSPKIYNGFNMLVNILHAYDVVSSYGLFLTKQGKFRKIDIKKISDQMINIEGTDGRLYSQEDMALFSLEILNLTECLRLEKDIGVISLKNIAEIIEDPVKLSKKILTGISSGRRPDEIFESIIEIPEYSGLRTVLSLLNRMKTTTPGCLETAFNTACNMSHIKKIDRNGQPCTETRKKEFESLMEFITIAGLLRTKGRELSATEEGLALYAAMSGKKNLKEKTVKKSIIINPDFTLMIQNADIDPPAMYIILSFTDIIKEDVIIEAAITKNSIINASKRGMHIDTFIETLGTYAKNSIPQNLEFLLNDWTNQTIRLDISRPILLFSSHNSFLDEISFSSMSGLLVKRISENYAIIEKDSIDDIIKFSKKFDVVLNIFENRDS